MSPRDSVLLQGTGTAHSVALQESRRYYHAQSALSTAGGTTPQPPIAARSRPAASRPPIGDWPVDHTAAPPRDAFLPPGKLAPRHIHQSALSLSRSTSSAPRSPSSAAGFVVSPRSDQRAVQRQTLLNLKLRPSRVSASSRAVHRAARPPRSTAHAHPGARWGGSPCCATALARPASLALCLQQPVSVLPLRSGSLRMRRPWRSWRWSSRLVSCACLACSAGAGTPAEGS